MVEKHCLTYQFIKYIPLNFSPQSILSAFRDLDLALQMFHKPNTSGKQEKAHKIVNFNNVSQPFSPYVQVQVQVLKDLYITTQWLNFPCISFLFIFYFVFILYLKIVLTWKIVKISKVSVLYIYIDQSYKQQLCCTRVFSACTLFC